MASVLRPAAFFSAALLAAALGRAAAGASPAAPLQPLAHSAQVEIDAAPTPQGLSLRVLPVQPGAALNVTGVTVSAGAGRSVAATPEADGSWRVPLAPGEAGARKVQIVVAHDGIREVLDAEEPARAAPAPPGGGWADHKQLAWWILNIVIVLIAAFAISRRMA